MLELRPRVTRVVETEDEPSGALACEVADLRVVAVHDEQRLRRQLAQPFARQRSARCSSSP